MVFDYILKAKVLVVQWTLQLFWYHIIYSTVYEKNVFVFVLVALEFTYYFDIRATVKLLKCCLIIS